MRRNRRLALAGLTTSALVASGFVAAAPATADVASPYFATSSNASDPHIIRCVNPTNTSVTGYCLYTSQDMGAGKYSGNPYPMEQTKLYYSDNGYSNWLSRGTVAHENWIEVGQPNGWVPVNAYHQWAPAAVRSGSDYYLYVPNVSNNSNGNAPNIHTSSRIHVWKFSGAINGPRTDLGFVSSTAGYMSDPDVLVDGSNRYLFWADGDGSNCGGLKSAKLGTDMKSLLANTTVTVSIAGVDILGNCGGKGRPYLEGSSIYKNLLGVPYTLVFAAKPTSVPLECQTAFTGGGANTANEVIAYATSSSAQGPFTYQGILMCGSTTEWTNQASIIEMGGRLVIIYHDGPAPGSGHPQRKLHAACLYAIGGRFTAVYRAPANAAHSFNDCMAQINIDYVPIGIRSPSGNARKTPLLISARSASPNYVEANRFLAGPNERWQWEWLGPDHYVIRSLTTGKLLCAPNGLSTDDLVASCTAINARSTFRKSCEQCSEFRLSNDATGRYVTIKSNNRLRADAVSESSGYLFT